MSASKASSVRASRPGRAWAQRVPRTITATAIALATTTLTTPPRDAPAQPREVPAQAPPPASAEAPLSLGEVLRASRSSYPLLLAALAQQEAASGEQDAAAGGFDTGFRAQAGVTEIGGTRFSTLETLVDQPLRPWGASVFAGWRLRRGDLPSYATPGATQALGEALAGVTLPLLRNRATDRRRTALVQTARGRELAEADVAVVRIEMERIATHRYWDWVMAGRRLGIARELLFIAQVRDEAIQRRAVLGDIAAIDKLDNERVIVERQERLVGAQRDLEQATIALSFFLRDEDGQPVLAPTERLPTKYPEPEEHVAEEGNLERALAQRPELRRIQLAQAQVRAELELADNQVLPAADLRVHAARGLGDSGGSKRPYEIGGALSFESPIERRVPRGRRRVVSATLDRLAMEERFVRDRIVAEVRDAVSALSAARERLLLARKQRELALALERAERTRFDLGESTILFVNLREQARGDAALAAVAAHNTWLRAQADHRAAMGDLAAP